MKQKLLISGFLAFSLLGSMNLAALAETFYKTLTLGAGAGTFENSDFGVGDRIILTLVNPTNRPLQFETTDNIGNEKTWVVGANSSTTIDFTYSQPFSDDVEYVVRDIGGAGTPVISQGTMIYSQRPAATQQTQVQETPAVKVQDQVVVPERPVSRPVRGYW